MPIQYYDKRSKGSAAYNDLAKEAHSNNDYVTAEIFRQYAEHYRKIVTEINERKQAREQQEANDNANAKVEAVSDNSDNTANEVAVENKAPEKEVVTEAPAETEEAANNEETTTQE